MRGRKENGRSVSLGVQMGCHSRSIRLVRGQDYEGSEQVRPLSPVNFRTKLPEDKVINQAPTLQIIKKRNEEKVRDSPFISHKSVRDRESWLLEIGSLEKPRDAYLSMEIDLKNQLSKIVTPIKVNQNSRGLHKPKLRKMPQHIQDEYNREEYLKKMERLHSSPPGHEGKASRSPLQDKRQYGYQQQELQHHQRLNESPTTIDPRSTTKSEKSTSSQAAVAGISTEKGRAKGGPRKKITAKMQHPQHPQHPYEQLSFTGGVSSEASNAYQLGSVGGQNDAWHDRHQIVSPSSHYGMMHSMVNLNGTATPISDLSDRDVFSAGSHLTGLYGDFEDDLVSAGSNNEDEYIRLEEKV